MRSSKLPCRSDRSSLRQSQHTYTFAKTKPYTLCRWATLNKSGRHPSSVAAPERGTGIGRRARELVETRFTADKTAMLTSDFYESCLDAAKHSLVLG